MVGEDQANEIVHVPGCRAGSVIWSASCKKTMSILEIAYIGHTGHARLFELAAIKSLYGLFQVRGCLEFDEATISTLASGLAWKGK